MSIWIDLDGVLADFDAGFAEAFGTDPGEASDDALWELIGSREGFFASLRPVEGAATFFSAVRELSRGSRSSPRILTACPVGALRERVISEKRSWVSKRIGVEIEVVPSDFGGSKSRHMSAKHEILIDDWHPNIDDWRSAGGVGVLWRGHDRALSSLKKALDRRGSLNILRNC